MTRVNSFPYHPHVYPQVELTTGCSKKRTPWFILMITSTNMGRF